MSALCRKRTSDLAIVSLGRSNRGTRTNPVQRRKHTPAQSRLGTNWVDSKNFSSNLGRSSNCFCPWHRGSTPPVIRLSTSARSALWCFGARFDGSIRTQQKRAAWEHAAGVRTFTRGGRAVVAPLRIASMPTDYSHSCCTRVAFFLSHRATPGSVSPLFAPRAIAWTKVTPIEPPNRQLAGHSSVPLVRC